MTLSLRTADAVRTVSAIKLLAGGSLRPAKTLKMMRGGSLVVVANFGPSAGTLSAAASPDYVMGSSYSSRPASVTSTPATVTPAGGVGPYSYAWAQTSGPGMTITAQGQATTSFRSNVYRNTILATFACTVTDASGAVATCDVTVELTHEGYGNGPIP